MERLPNELLDRICSFLERRDLRAVSQLSARFRRLAILPFLSRFGITHSHLQSGSISLSDSFDLILVVAQLCPIQRLVCFEEPDPGSRLRYQRLAAILSVTAPIPDIVIYNRQYMLQRTRRETVFLLSRIPQVATTTFLIVQGNSMCLSRPRSAPPIRWRLLPPPLGGASNHLPTTMKVLLVLFGIPLLFAYLVSGLINCVVLIKWTYRRFFRPPWPHANRIISDAGLLVFDDWIRIQNLPGQLTLVTLTERRAPVLTLRPLPGLGKDIYTSILPALDLGFYLQQLTVETDANVSHDDLMAFISRHPALGHLSLQPDSLIPSSLATLPMPLDSPSTMHMLTAPASYIPYLLPAAPNLQRIRLPFYPAPALAKHLPTLTPAFDLPAHRLALAAIAALPGTHPLTLALAVRLTAPALPWAAAPTATDVFPRIHELALAADGSARFRAPTIRALMPWLARFPGLQRVSFAHGAVERIPLAERAVLAEAICAACSGVGTVQDVAFNIKDD